MQLELTKDEVQVLNVIVQSLPGDSFPNLPGMMARLQKKFTNAANYASVGINTKALKQITHETLLETENN
jgi:hypothetical protein